LYSRSWALLGAAREPGMPHKMASAALTIGYMQPRSRVTSAMFVSLYGITVTPILHSSNQYGTAVDVTSTYIWYPDAAKTVEQLRRAYVRRDLENY
jgi:hypothetical protein